MENVQVEVVAKKRGRPVGGKNRPKEVITAEKEAKLAKLRERNLAKQTEQKEVAVPLT